MQAPAGVSDPPPEQWQVAWAASQPALARLAAAPAAAPTWLPRIFRSSQLDAGRLDDELTLMLQEQFMRVFMLFQPGRVSAADAELQALLRLLVFRLSVWRGRATPGSELMGLKYVSMLRRGGTAGGGGAAAGSTPTLLTAPDISSAQKLAFGVGYVLVPYLWSRLGCAVAMRQEEYGGAGGASAASAATWLRRVDAAHGALSLLNAAAFLRNGAYRSLLERFLGMRLVYRQANMSRAVSFEYLNRQLVWHELSEFLLFLLPLINVARIKRAVRACLPSGAAAMQALAGAAGGGIGSTAPSAAKREGGGAAGRDAGGDATAAPPEPCPVCGAAEVLTPFLALPCRHAFCYYCLASNVATDSGYACPLDGKRVDALQRLRGQPAPAAAAGTVPSSSRGRTQADAPPNR